MATPLFPSSPRSTTKRSPDAPNATTSNPELAILLGCVIAHLLGHLLLAEPGHSATGIMQPEWGNAQIHQALTGNFLFTRDQAVRIQSQTRILASLPRNPAQAPITP